MPSSAMRSSSPVVMPACAAFIKSVRTFDVIFPLRRMTSISRADLSATTLVRVLHADDVEQLVRDLVDGQQPVDFHELAGAAIVLHERHGLLVVDVQTMDHRFRAIVFALHERAAVVVVDS